MYKKGKEKVAADCLSRQVDTFGKDYTCAVISTVIPHWITEIAQYWESDPGLMDIIVQL